MGYCELLYAKAYAEYIPAMIELENLIFPWWEYVKQIEEMKRTLNEVFNDPDLTEELIIFYKGTHKMCKQIKDYEWIAKNGGYVLGRENPLVKKVRLAFYNY